MSLEKNSDDEGFTLLPDSEVHDANDDDGKAGTAGIGSSVFNICNNILGAGVLTMPYAFRRASTIPAMIVLVVMALYCGYSFLLLCRSSILSKKTTYKAIGIKCFGQRAGMFCEMVVCAMTMGSCISYNILVGDFIPEVSQYFYDSSSGAAHPILKLTEDRRFVIAICTYVFLLPLCLFKKLDSLRFSSTVGVICITFCAIVIVYFAFKNDEPASYRESTKLFDLNVGLFISSALMSVAFTMHYNALQFWKELKHQSEKRAQVVIQISFFLSWLLYGMVGFAGYYTFGENTEGDVLKSYQNASYGLLVECNRLFLAVCVAVTYPLPFFACRKALFTVIWGSPDYSNPWKFYPLTVLLVSITVAIAIAAKDVSVVLAFKGSLLGTPIVMIMPALFYLQLTPGKMFCLKKWLPISLLVFGIITSLMGTIITILDVSGVLNDPT